MKNGILTMPKKKEIKNAPQNDTFTGLLGKMCDSTCLYHLLSTLFIVRCAEILLQQVSLNYLRDIAIIGITIATSRIWSIKYAELIKGVYPDYRHSTPYQMIQYFVEVNLIFNVIATRHNTILSWFLPDNLPSQLVLAAATTFCIALIGWITVSLAKKKH